MSAAPGLTLANEKGCDSMREPTSSLFAMDANDDDDSKLRYLQAEEDPLVFRDEDEETDNEDHNDDTILVGEDSLKMSRKKRILGRLGITLLLLILIIPCLLLGLDLHYATNRMRAAFLDPELRYLSVDLSDKLPVVVLEGSVPTSAFPRWTSVQPEKVVCQLFESNEDGVMVTVAEVLPYDGRPDSGTRAFSLRATLTPGTVELETYAGVSWTLLTQQTSQAGITCQLHFDLMIANRFHRHHVGTEFGEIDFKQLGVWETKDEFENPPPPVLTSSAGSNQGNQLILLEWPDVVASPVDDETTTSSSSHGSSYGLSWIDADGVHHPGSAQLDDPTMPPTSDSLGQDDSTSIAPAVPDYQDDFAGPQASPQYYGTYPLDPEKNEPNNENDSTPNAVVIEQLTWDRILLGVNLSLPKRLFELIPQIHVLLPPVSLSAKASTHSHAFLVSTEELDLSFSSLADANNFKVEVTCPDEGDCRWFTPLLDMLGEIFKPTDQYQTRTLVDISIDADQSFLEAMMGTLHQLVFQRMQVPITWMQRRKMRDVGHEVRELLSARFSEDMPVDRVDCIQAQDALLGDVFSLSWCMDLILSEKIAVDGHIKFYDYGGSVSAEAAWEQEDDILRVDADAVVDITIKDKEEPKMNLAGSATLDLDSLSVSTFVNNTADWWPFSMVVQGNLFYDDPQDALDIILEKATFNGNSETYADAKGSVRVDFGDQTISAVLNDPRLQVAMDVLVMDESLSGEFEVVFEDENVMTGDAAISFDDGLPVVRATSDGLLTMSLDAGPSLDDNLSWELRQAKLLWDDEELMDATMWGLFENWELIMIGIEERTHDHNLSFIFTFSDAPYGTLASSTGKLYLRVGGNDLLDVLYTMNLRHQKDGFELIDGKYKGGLQLIPGNIVSNPEVDLLCALQYEWDNYEERLDGTLEKLRLGISGTTYIDATGNMTLDVGSNAMTLEAHDKTEVNNRGFDLSASVSEIGDLIIGTIEELKVVSEGNTIMDASLEASLNLQEKSIEYRFEEFVSETSMGLEEGTIVMDWDDQDELESMNLSFDGMAVVIEGDPWVRGGMEVGLDLAKSSFSVAMDNNTTKLPNMDMGFIVTIDDSRVFMSALGEASAAPTRPPEIVEVEPATTETDLNATETTPNSTVASQSSHTVSPTNESAIMNATLAPAAPRLVRVNSTFIVFNTEGLNAEALLLPENLAILEEAFADFVTNLVNAMETKGEKVPRRALLKSPTGQGLRWLEVSLHPGSARVVDVRDVDCEPDGTTPIPGGARCQNIYGQYYLSLDDDQDKDAVYESYVKATDKAIADGKLQERLEEASPDSWPIAVAGPVPRNDNNNNIGSRADTSGGSKRRHTMEWRAIFAACLVLCAFAGYE